MFNNSWTKTLLFFLLVSTVSADHDTYEKKMAVLDGTLYITTSYYGSSGYLSKLWSYDGSTMTEVSDLASNWVSNIVALDSKLVIFVSGSGIYTYDPSAASGSRLSQVVSGSTYYSNFVPYDSKVYFTYYASGSYYLASFDGSTISSGVSLGSNYPQYFVTYNSKIYWLQGSGSTYYLYYYDGSDVVSTTEYLSYYPQAKMVVFDNKLTIFANNQIYSYDGTASSPSIDYKVDSGGYPYYPTAVGDRIYFGIYSGTNYYLKYYDGSSVSSASSTALGGYLNGMVAYSGRPIFYIYDSNSSSYKVGGYNNGSLYNLASDTENDPPSKAADLVTSSSGTWLHDFTEYSGTLYWMKDQSALWKYAIATIEFSSGYPYSYNVSSTSLDISVKTDLDGKVYYVVLADGATAPTSAQVKAGTDASGTSATSGDETVLAEEAARISISLLSTSTSYDIYVVAEDNSENLQSSPTKVEATTTATALAVFASGYPTVTIASSGTSGTLTVKADKDSEVYYVVLADGTTAPTSAQVKDEADGSATALSEVAKGYDTSVEADDGTSATETSLTISGLTASMEYDLWIVLYYSTKLPSSPTLVDVSTDKTAPTVATGYPSASNIGQTDFTLAVKANENSTAYFVVLADGATRPDTTEIKNGQDGSGATSGVLASDNFSLKADTENSQSITGLSAGTSYDVWVAVEDGSANSNIATAVKEDVELLAPPVVITVKKDGTGDYTTIQDAINAVSSTTKEDTVEVYEGTYEENIDFGGKNIVVRSKSGPASTIITPSSSGTWKAIVWFKNGEAGTAKLVGFTLKDGGNESDGSAINIEGSSATIENCIITNNPKYAIRLQDSGSKIINTLVYGNTGDGTILFDTYTTTNYPSIINCTIADNNGYGLKNIKSYQPTVTNSIIYGNSSGGVLGNFSMTYCIVEGSYSGTGNKSEDPVFSGISRTTASDYLLSDYSPAIGTGTVVSNVTPTVDLVSSSRGTPPDMGAYENSRSTPLTDTEAPTAGTVSDGLSAEIAYTGSPSELSATWKGFSDGGSGIAQYEYAIDISETSITGSIVTWTSTGTETFVTKSELSLIEGNTYYVSVRATDVALNVSSVATSNGVTVDLTAPTLSSTTPASDAFVNHTAVSYTLSEAISSGTVTWTRTGGTEDSNSPHTKALAGDELNAGTHTNITLTNSPTLVDGAVYTIAFDAADAAGNSATTVSGTAVTYDVTAPAISSTSPAASSSVNHTAVSYTLSEAISSGTVIWTRTGGTEDSNSPHTKSLTGDELNSGAHTNITLTNNPTLVGGAIYTVSFDVTDLAGNSATTVSNTGIIYDVTLPVISSTTPASDAFVNHTAVSYTLSKAISSGTVTWTRTGGSEDSNSPHVKSLAGDELNAGTHTNITLTNSPILVDGAVYTIAFDAADAAGSSAATVSNTSVVYDITPPSITLPMEGSLTEDFDYQNDATTIIVSWEAGTDASSGIQKYETALGTTVGGTETVGWTSAGLATTDTLTGLSLIDGTVYYVSVRAVDKAGNISPVATGDGITIDLSPPTTGIVIDGLDDDMEFTGSSTTLSASWSGFGDAAVGIGKYEYAIGTTIGGLEVLGWQSSGTDTSMTLGELTLANGTIYYVSVRATDSVGNVSAVVSSDGVTVDVEPPSAGIVNDGLGDDETWVNSTTTFSANWFGFSDELSGIDMYEYAIGSSNGATNVLGWTNAGVVSSISQSGLSLLDGTTYYFSVRAIDNMGNISTVSVSDGATVDMMPPSVSQIDPGTTTLLDLIQDSNISITFTEVLQSADVEVASTVAKEIEYSVDLSGTQMTVSILAPLTSLDTVKVTVTGLTDLSGLAGGDTTYTFYTKFLGDYNDDRMIDAFDLSGFVGGWQGMDFSLELGPVMGEAPHFVPQVDGEYNLRDVMAFTRMWHWYHGTPQLLNLARVNFGDELDVTVNDKSLTVTIPEHVIAGQLAFQVSDSELSVTLPEEKTGDVILLSHTEAGLLQSVMDFAYFNENGERNFVLPLEYGRHSSTLTLSYALYGKDGVVTGQGVVTMDVTPVPAEFVLNQNYPNPFNPTTQIEYGLPVDGQVKLTVYDLLGQEVRSLVSGLDQSAGYHNIMWDARDNRGLAVSAGVYIYRLVSRGEDGQKFSRTKKMVLLK